MKPVIEPKKMQTSMTPIILYGAMVGLGVVGMATGSTTTIAPWLISTILAATLTWDRYRSYIAIIRYNDFLSKAADILKSPEMEKLQEMGRKKFEAERKGEVNEDK